MALRAMFAARKSVFVDLLEWDLPVVAGTFEIDQFDDEFAQYLILLGDGGQHLASARLLPTDRPHILDSVFPELCEHPIPQDAFSFEITRFCMDRSLRAAARRAARDQLITGMVNQALYGGWQRFTAVTDMAFLQQILSFGWDCRPLGLPVKTHSGVIGALEIRISGDTPALLARAGIWSPVPTLQNLTMRAASLKG
ncbi:MAG: autoinducer synthase [Pseudomonadota bacterium]|nr:autoinducer synthase [Pseudomonadota bacterium]